MGSSHQVCEILGVQMFEKHRANVRDFSLKNKQPFNAAKCFGIELTKSIKKKLPHRPLREDAAVVLPTVADQA